MPKNLPSVDIVGVGRATVDYFSKQTGLRLADPANQHFQKSVGGSTANILVGAQRLGLTTRLLTRVGADANGDYVRSVLTREGVDVSAVVSDPDPLHLTGVAQHSVCPDEGVFELSFLRVNAADTFHSEADFGPEHFVGARVVALSGTGLSRSPGREASLKALRLGREAGLKPVIDLDYRDVWVGGKAEYREVVSATLPSMSLIVANSEELELVTGEAGVRGVASLRRTAPDATVVFKDAEHGATAYVPDQAPVFVAAFEVKLLTIRGAGDGFLAGFLHGWLDQQPLERCLRLANAVGAIQVTTLACAQGMPTLEQAQAFIQNTPVRPGR